MRDVLLLLLLGPGTAPSAHAHAPLTPLSFKLRKCEHKFKGANKFCSSSTNTHSDCPFSTVDACVPLISPCVDTTSTACFVAVCRMAERVCRTDEHKGDEGCGYLENGDCDPVLKGDGGDQGDGDGDHSGGGDWSDGGDRSTAQY